MQRDANLESAGSLSAILGYLNFSEGKPDCRFEKQLNLAYATLAERGEPTPWIALHEILTERLEGLQKEGGAFQDIRQAHAVLESTFTHVLPAYRHHHQDLLAHLSDAELYQPFFLARVAEAVLAQGPPWMETERIVAGALNHINDYVGYRPIAILETRPKGEPYPHERVRPIPLYIRGSGVACGRYHLLIERTIQFLKGVDPAILSDASFDLELLDELALDPRAYDQSHPASRPRNYIFGEWDPHHIDDQGRYRRFVVRGVVLDALMDRAQAHGLQSAGFEESLFEAAAVFAGTILMASGICGDSPTAHDSTVTLSKLIPRIARCREAFYANILELAGSPMGPELIHAERLREEASRLKQPFGGARQHLNEFLAKHRAAQLQHRHVALLYAEMGYLEASRQEANKIPVVSSRFLSEIWICLTTTQRFLSDGRLAAAAKLPPEVYDLIRRGIDCGALPDPWNILGFQGIFPLSAAQEDSIRDPRIDELIHIMQHLFDVYSRLLSEAASAGERVLVQSITADMKRVAAWWDRFASVEVQDVERVHGGEAETSAEHVAESMARWHEKGEATGDLAFWKQHLEGFRTPKAFTLVLNALFHKKDYRATMALLMTWLNQVEQVPLEDGPYSFHGMARRWMMGATGSQGADEEEKTLDWSLVQRFFDNLEANAEDYWNVPEWETAEEGTRAKGEDFPFAAAFEGMTYQDTTDDDTKGTVADGGAPSHDLDLERESQRLSKRLRFISTVARLWQVAAWRGSRLSLSENHEAALEQWLDTALTNQKKLLLLLDSIHDHPIPKPMGSYESMVEYDRRRALKEHLLHTAVATGLDLHLAAVAIRGVRTPIEGSQPSDHGKATPAWEPIVHRLVHALIHGDSEMARALLPAFVQSFQKEPLLFPALSEGGHPRQILRVRIAQTMLRTLLANLPRLGLLRETFQLLQTTREMERNYAPDGLALTEFNHLFQAAFEGVVETLVESSETWPPIASDLPLNFNVSGTSEFSAQSVNPISAPPTHSQPEFSDGRLVDILEALTGPFFRLWVEQSQTVRLSVMEKLRPEEWEVVRTFVERYGRDLFHVKFMTLANLRGILRGGIQAFLEFLLENPDPLRPIQLINDIETHGTKPGGLDVVHLLECILEILVEYYDHYKEYNNTSPQSDYGDKLYVLLDFLRVKASHDRHRWQLRPLYWTHEVLVAHGHLGAAHLWQQQGSMLTQSLSTNDLEVLDRLEKTHGLKLPSISEHIRERFGSTMEVDRLCALVESAMEDEDRAVAANYFAELQRQVDSRTASPSGTGIELPDWLSRLEHEVARVRTMQSDDVFLDEGFVEMAQIPMSLDDVQRQIEKWPQSPEGS